MAACDGNKRANYPKSAICALHVFRLLWRAVREKWNVIERYHRHVITTGSDGIRRTTAGRGGGTIARDAFRRLSDSRAIKRRTPETRPCGFRQFKTTTFVFFFLTDFVERFVNKSRKVVGKRHYCKHAANVQRITETTNGLNFISTQVIKKIIGRIQLFILTIKIMNEFIWQILMHSLNLKEF